MGTELLLLSASVILGVVQLFLATAAVTSVRGSAYNMGNREEPVPPLKGMPARLQMAFENFKETFSFFAVAVLLAASTNHLGSLTALGAELYFFGRLVYVPVYAIGIKGLRTLVWLVSVVGIVLVLAALFA